jgi:UDP-N-acetylmuramoyl-L-alanyl-D-glutamate--2,6-diaminopimelate ligase
MTNLYSLISNKVINKYQISNLLIKGITCDSRKVKKGYIFAVFKGFNKNGINYINQAIEKGASAILIDEKDLKAIKKSLEVTIIPSSTPRKKYALICNKFSNYDFDNIIGVTGTNGKTSVAWFVNKLTKLLGVDCASIGTLGVDHNSIKNNNSLTTPESEVLISHLNNLYYKNVKNIIIEASSHGLDQFRLEGINFNIVVITTLSRDHLDYHKTFDDYKRAKLKLFSDVSNTGVAIINECIPKYKEFIEAAKSNNLKIITIGNSISSNWKYKIKNVNFNEQEIEVTFDKVKTTIFTGLIGKFQINNLVTAISILVEMGFKRDRIDKLISKLKAPPGRLEFIKNIKGANIYIDYAHTPDALENVLISIRPHVKNKLYLVFGCGGDRDKGKRPLMGEIANTYADEIIITDDNPRYEDPKTIRNQIVSFCPNSREIANRTKAINFAINNLEKGDVLLVVGKGHENTQEIKGKFLKFNDSIVIKKIIRGLVN